MVLRKDEYGRACVRISSCRACSSNCLSRNTPRALPSLLTTASKASSHSRVSSGSASEAFGAGIVVLHGKLCTRVAYARHRFGTDRSLLYYRRHTVQPDVLGFALNLKGHAMMASQRTLLVALLMSASAIAAPTLSPAAINVDIDVAPPAPRVEVVPGPRAHYVWAPGYWGWRGHAHAWVRGHWIRERPGYRWVPDQWVQAGPHWHYARGHWDR